MTFQNYLQASLNRIDHYYELPDCDPENYGSEAQVILEEVSKRLAKQGQTELYTASLEVPACDPIAIKTFLTRCITKPQSEYLDANAAAEYLGISLKSLYTLVERRRLIPLRGPRRTYRFTKGMLDAYLSSGGRSKSSLPPNKARS
jgi:excisionase family DNA binding protein